MHNFIEGEDEIDELLLLRQYLAPTPDQAAQMNPATAVEWAHRNETGVWTAPTWDDRLNTAEEVLEAFDVGAGEGAGQYADIRVIAAFYSQENYAGYADVYFEQNGVLYEVHGSHCSCMGLGGQWANEPTPHWD